MGVRPESRQAVRTAATTAGANRRIAAPIAGLRSRIEADELAHVGAVEIRLPVKNPRGGLEESSPFFDSAGFIGRFQRFTRRLGNERAVDQEEGYRHHASFRSRCP